MSEAPEILDDLRNSVGYLLCVADIHRIEMTDTSSLTYPAAGLLAADGVQIRQRYLGSLLPKQQCGSRADANGTACDNGDFALQSHRGSPNPPLII